ncbi:MLP-like protein 328 [Momordica charantia]|uniref:MLP-like protein 328 n=1 Tax=Momordica charantia TaxID=3673 RepID=A0A6J1DWQ0_MOMCH|nr:MLP-like protein 328 [Momordica charantia]
MSLAGKGVFLFFFFFEYNLAGKLVSEIEINAIAEKYYKVFKYQSFNLPNISPKFIQRVEVQGGDWDSHGHGSVQIWNYTTPDCEAEVYKDRVEFDDEKLAMIMIGFEGDVFNLYKTFNATYQAVPKSPNYCLAILSIEYEKLNDSAPYPYKYLDIMNGVTKDIESYLK